MEHCLWVRSALLPDIESGAKRIELRAKNSATMRIHTGDTINYNDNRVTRSVTAVREHPSIAAAVEKEGAERICPQQTAEEIIEGFERIHGHTPLTILAFEL